MCCTVGHGLSEGDRIHIDSIEMYARDVIQHVERLKVEHPTLPVFLFGHSMVSCKATCHPHCVVQPLSAFSAMCLSATHLGIVNLH